MCTTMAATDHLCPGGSEAPAPSDGGEWCAANIAVSQELHAWLTKLCHVHAPPGTYAAVKETLGALGDRVRCTVSLCGAAASQGTLTSIAEATQPHGVLLLAIPVSTADAHRQYTPTPPPLALCPREWLSGPEGRHAMVVQGTPCDALPPVPHGAEMLAAIPLVFTKHYTYVVPGRRERGGNALRQKDYWSHRAHCAGALARGAEVTARRMHRALRATGEEPWLTLGCSAPPAQGSWPYGLQVVVAVTCKVGSPTERAARDKVVTAHGCSVREHTVHMRMVWDTVACRPSRLVHAALEAERSGAIFDTRVQLRGVPGLQTAHVSMDLMEQLYADLEPGGVPDATGLQEQHAPPPDSQQWSEAPGWVWVFTA